MNQKKSGRLSAPIAVATAILALHVTSASAGASSDACRVPAHAQVLARSTSGVIYRKKFHELSRAYGCLFSTGRVRALAGQNQTQPGPVKLVTAAKLSGRFAAYVLLVEGDYNEVAVFDLKRGRLIIHQLAEAGFVDRVRSFVAKRNGSIAWIVQGPAYDENHRPYPGGDYEVRKVEVRNPSTSVELASGNDISGKSLRLSHDRRTISWVQANQERTARLR